MKTALIFHGVYDDRNEYEGENTPSASNDHWFPWLQKQLVIRGIPTQTPEILNCYYPDYPDYPTWESELKRYVPNADSILIGHSCGGGFLIRWLSENDTKIDKLILVAPWFDPERRSSGSFFDFQINPNLQSKANEIHVLISDNEEDKDVRLTVDEITKALPTAKLHVFKGLGHFVTSEMGRVEFPELLDIVLK